MNDRRGVALVALAAASWGLWSLFLRPTGLPGTVTSALMLLFVAVFALPFARREPPPRWDRGAVVLLVANGAFDALNVLTFFAALDHTTVAIAVLTHYFAPVLVAVASPWIDRTVTPGAPTAAGVATIGLALVLQPWRDQADGVWLGAALGTTSALAYAANVFVLRRLGPRIGAARTLSYHGFIGAALLAPVAAADLGAVEARDLALIGAGSLVLGAAGGIAFIVGLARIGSARASVLTFAEPLVAVVAGWLAFGEGLSPAAAAGAALVLAAGVAVARAPLRAAP